MTSRGAENAECMARGRLRVAHLRKPSSPRRRGVMSSATAAYAAFDVKVWQAACRQHLAARGSDRSRRRAAEPWQPRRGAVRYETSMSRL